MGLVGWFFFFCFWQLQIKTSLGQNRFSADGSVAAWPSPQPAEPDTPLLPAATGPSGFQLAKSSAKPGAL